MTPCTYTINVMISTEPDSEGDFAVLWSLRLTCLQFPVYFWDFHHISRTRSGEVGSHLLHSLQWASTFR